MAIIINEMEKPTSCWKCPFLTEAEWLCLVSKRHVYNVEQPIPAWCPITELVTCSNCKTRGTKDCVSYEAFWELGDDGFCSAGETNGR